MSAKLKVCQRCMESLSASPDASADLGTYLVATGCSGVEVVEESLCQYKRACGQNARPQPPPRGLADVSEVELDAAISGLLKELDLRSYSQPGARQLADAIKYEWLLAREKKDADGVQDRLPGLPDA